MRAARLPAFYILINIDTEHFVIYNIYADI